MQRNSNIFRRYWLASIYSIIVKTTLANSRITQQTRHAETTMFQCWPNVCDAGPTLKHHRLNVPCLLGRCILQWNIAIAWCVAHCSTIFSLHNGRPWHTEQPGWYCSSSFFQSLYKVGSRSAINLAQWFFSLGTALSSLIGPAPRGVRGHHFVPMSQCNISKSGNRSRAVRSPRTSTLIRTGSSAR